MGTDLIGKDMFSLKKNCRGGAFNFDFHDDDNDVEWESSQVTKIKISNQSSGVLGTKRLLS